MNWILNFRFDDVVDVPDAGVLQAHTQRVLEITAYTDAKRLTPSDPPAASPIVTSRRRSVAHARW